MRNNLVPDYMRSMLPQSVEERTGRALRNNENYTQIQSSTTLYQQSFLPSAIRDWNNLDSDTKNSRSLNAFKHTLTRNVHNNPTYYSTGNRLFQIHHCRLRLECSSLHSHLYKRNLVESPKCACGQDETTDHFLLRCPNYYAQRTAHLSTLPCPPILGNLLFGCENISTAENTVLFTKVQSYIKATQRFQTV